MESPANLTTVLSISLAFVSILSVVLVAHTPNPREEFRLKVKNDLDAKFATHVERLAEKTIEVASYEANDDGEIDVDNGAAVAKVIRGGLDSTYLDIESLGQGVDDDVADVQRDVRRVLPAVRQADRWYVLCCRTYFTSKLLTALTAIAFLISLLSIAVPVVYDGPLPDWVGQQLSARAVLAGLIGLALVAVVFVVFFASRRKLKKLLRKVGLMEEAQRDGGAVGPTTEPD